MYWLRPQPKRIVTRQLLFPHHSPRPRQPATASY